MLVCSVNISQFTFVYLVLQVCTAEFTFVCCAEFTFV